MEEFSADLDCIVEEAMEAGATYAEIIGACTAKAQQVGLIAMGVLDADAEDDEEEEV